MIAATHKQREFFLPLPSKSWRLEEEFRISRSVRRKRKQGRQASLLLKSMYQGKSYSILLESHQSPLVHALIIYFCLTKPLDLLCDIHSGKMINPHNPEYITKRPWYLGESGPSLNHHAKQHSDEALKLMEAEEIIARRPKFTGRATTYRKVR